MDYIRAVCSISIHAPHAGSDHGWLKLTKEGMHFNPRSPCGERRRRHKEADDSMPISIHAPHAGSDACAADCAGKRQSFQSTLPMRGATPSALVPMIHSPYFNPRSPCGERRQCLIRMFSHAHFNPRSPCGERQFNRSNHNARFAFQSTLPMRGATCAHRRWAKRPRFQSTLPMRGAT